MTDYLPPLLWKPSPNFNSRGGCVIDQIIIHDMEGGFTGSVTWLDNSASHVSAHYGVSEDGQSVVLMVDPQNRAWHACDFNSRSIGIEMAGFARNGFSDAEKLTTARICAHLCRRFGIPIRHAAGGVGPGIESHYGLGRAGGGHSDPSTDPGWMPAFIALVQAESNAARYPILWSPAPSTASGAPAPAPAAGGLATTESVQAALARLKFAIAVDGQVGSQTEGVLEAFQIIAGLRVTRTADAATKAVILKALSGG